MNTQQGIKTITVPVQTRTAIVFIQYIAF